MSLSWENSPLPYTIVTCWDTENHDDTGNEAYSWQDMYNSGRLTIEVNNFKLKQSPDETIKMFVEIRKEQCRDNLSDFVIEPQHGISKIIRLCHHSYHVELLFSNYLHEFSHDYIYEVVCKLLKPDQSKAEHLFSCCINRASRFTSSEMGYVPLESNSLASLGRQVYFCIRRHRATMKINPEINMNLAILRNLGCDVVFEVKGGQFVSAHRSILEIHSPVISSMFKKEASGNKSGIIEIMSIEKNVVYKMLDFLYTGEIDEIEDLAEPLFDIAHYFQMDKLVDHLQEHYLFSINPNNKNIVEIITLAELYNLKRVQECLLTFTKRYEVDLVAMPSYCDYIIDSINVENSVNRLLLSIKYNLNNVKTKAFDFIKEHYNEMIKNAAFLNMFISHGDLMKQIHIHVHHNPDADRKL